MKTGIQVSSLKPLLLTSAQVSAAFARMKALDCEYVQLQWIDPSVPPADIARALKENGMVSVSLQDFYQTVQENFEYYVNLNHITGGKWFCVSRIPDHLKTPAGLEVFAQELRDMQRQLDPYGQQLCFHPVSADYQAIPGMDAVETLMELMQELTLCLDLYHLNRCCPDMPGYIRKFAGRVCMVHFKESRDGKLVPAGQGDIDWTGVVEACVETGVPYGFVEQETWDRDPYDCLNEALQWLRAKL